MQHIPKELLSQSTQERYQYFEKLLVMHPRFVEARDAVWEALHNSSSPVLVNLIGPASAGKTTLLSWIKQQLLAEALPELLTDLGRIPFVAVDAIPPTATSFDWNDFMVRCLLLLNEPLIEEKEFPRIISSNQRRTVRHYIRHEEFSPQLLQAVEQSLYYRHVPIFMVDDAVYLGIMYGQERLVERFRNIKNIMQRSSTTWLFAGTYNLLELMTKMELAGWKSVNVHFRRYQFDSENNQDFQNILLTFQQHLPVLIEPDFLQHAQYLYSGCVGCVGLLKSWLSRSFAAALEDGSDTITFEHLERHRLPSFKLEKLIDEIEQGEELFMQWNDQRGHHPEKPQRQRVNRPKVSRRRVGHRNPVRDRVGE